MALTTFVSFSVHAGATSASSCSGLATRSWAPPGDAVALVVDSATLVAANPTQGTPEYCAVNGHLDTEINFILNLPTAWNDKIQMMGNSGFGGSGDLQNMDLFSALNNGYALVGTDMGHPNDASDFLNRPDRIKNFNHRSVHLVSLASKELTSSYYGSAVKHSYFNGCSRGGTEGMKEASQYPTDFDGIIAGAPNLPNNGGFRLWNSKAIFPTGPTSGLLPFQKIPLISQAVFAKCDALDGIVDGIIDDPKACNFSPSRDLPKCAGDVDGPNCFTKVQIAALEKIHDGPSIYGFPLGPKYYFSGVEGFSYGDAFGLGFNVYDFAYRLTGFPGVPSLYPDFFDVGMPSQDYWLEENTLRYLVFSNATYELHQFNYNSVSDVLRYTVAVGQQLANSPDLSAFAAHGGKLLEWHGLGDPVINPSVTRDFYDDGTLFSGGLARQKGFDRLFLVPGTTHCGGGPGPWNFDPVPALENWVENGQAPQQIIGNNPDSGISRPICAYPKAARLISPTADPTQSSSFKCVNVTPRFDDVQ